MLEGCPKNIFQKVKLLSHLASSHERWPACKMDGGTACFTTYPSATSPVEKSPLFEATGSRMPESSLDLWAIVGTSAIL